MSTSTVLAKRLDRKYKITLTEVEAALNSGTDLSALVADKFNMDQDTVKSICDAYMSLLIIKKSRLQDRV